MTRNCPVCDNILTYKYKCTFVKANKLNSSCLSCASKERSNRPEVIEKNRQSNLGKHKGELNPFFGKKHSKETLEVIRKKALITNKGERNPMYGKNVYSVWVEKYGEEIANEKLIELKKKQSFNSKGEKNGMYGKPSPTGSGNGWSGWYKGWFFRSLRELSYMVNVIERFNIKWRSAETADLKIKYSNGNRTYSADFLLNEKYLVECKPKSLSNSKIVLEKKEAALIFCKLNGYIYKIVNPKRMKNKEIMDLYNLGSIKFTDRYQEKFKNKYL